MWSKWCFKYLIMISIIICKCFIEFSLQLSCTYPFPKLFGSSEGDTTVSMLDYNLATDSIAVVGGTMAYSLF